VLGPARWIFVGTAFGLACSAAPTLESSEQTTPVTEASSTTEPTVVQTTEPMVDQTTEPMVVQTTEPMVVQTPEPMVDQTTEPMVVQTTGEQGIAFLTMNGIELTMDVRTPPGDVGLEAGRPVVVLFHGLSSATNDADDVTVVADAAAAAGMVVFSPEWINGDPFPLLLDDISMLRRAGECAVAFAQEHAPRFGGDPARMVTSGFSAGTGPALTAAVEPVTGTAVAGCVSPAATDPVVGTVLGDGEYFWQSEEFDEAFSADPVAMLGETVSLIEPSNWEANPALRIRLWAAADRTAPRLLDADTGEVDWLTARDGDGSIRSELGEIGALDDASVDYVDSAALLERRAVAAGFDVELEIFPGGHTTNDKAPAIVRQLLAAAGEP
jgi:dienelactone hydrolase